MSNRESGPGGRSRSEQLRARHRKVLAWALGVSGALHVAFFLWLFAGQEPATVRRIVLEPESAVGGRLTPVAVRFGPPAIRARDGTTYQEPAAVHLDAARAVPLPKYCAVLPRVGRPPLHGRVHLEVKKTGLVDVVGVVRSTGSRCGDYVMAMVARDLRYGWLPDERFPSPVDLVQPVQLADLPK